MSHRVEVTLTDEQYERLAVEARRAGVSLAEVVRRALTARYGETDRASTLRALDESFGAWADRDFSGVDYVDGRRSGMADHTDALHHG
ncbi:MAG: CopG family transcriptional regulator, partial [Dehalococcoidia bacterium]